MAKVAIVFWSGTGHTEKMAHCIMDGLKAGGAQVELFPVSKLLSAALQWGLKSLNQTNLNPFLLRSKANWQGAKSHCLALTNGQVANGCRHG